MELKFIEKALLEIIKGVILNFIERKYLKVIIYLIYNKSTKSTTIKNPLT